MFPYLEAMSSRAKRRQRRRPWRRVAEDLVNLHPCSAEGRGRRGSRRPAATAADHRQDRSNRRHPQWPSLSQAKYDLAFWWEVYVFM